MQDAVRQGIVFLLNGDLHVKTGNYFKIFNTNTQFSSPIAILQATVTLEIEFKVRRLKHFGNLHILFLRFLC